MFLHIGCNVSVPLKSIIAIYDIRNNKNEEFISSMKNNKKIKDISQSSPKSCIITDNKIYLSSISAVTLYNRSLGRDFDEDD